MGPRAGLDGRKISSPPGFGPGQSSLYSVAIPTELADSMGVQETICVYLQTGFRGTLRLPGTLSLG